jgi:hypothetical protein
MPLHASRFSGVESVVVLFSCRRYGRQHVRRARSTHTRDDLEDAIAFALRFRGRKRVHTAGKVMAAITAERVVAHLEEAGIVVIRKPPGVGAAETGDSGACRPAVVTQEMKQSEHENRDDERHALAGIEPFARSLP